MTRDILIRPAMAADVPVIVHHRRAMLTDMGIGEPAGLDAIQATFTPSVARALDDGSFRGWLAQAENGRIVSGDGWF